MIYRVSLLAIALLGLVKYSEGQTAVAQERKVDTAALPASTEPVPASSLLFKNKPVELKKINLNFLLRSSLEIPDGDAQGGIKMNEARFEVMGTLAPDLDFRVRYRLNRSQAPRSQDNSPGSVDHASVNYRFGKNKKWSVNVGKQAAYVGSWEFETNPTFEYQYSEFVNNQTNIFLMAIRLGYKLNENHSVYLQLHNTYNENFNTLHSTTGYQANGLKGSKAPMGVYASWLGKLFDQKLHTFWSYNVSKFASGKVNHAVALGNKVVLKNFHGYLDVQSAWLAVDYPNIASPSINKYRSFIVPGTAPVFARDVNYKSAVLRLDYQFMPGFFATTKGYYETASQFKGNSLAGNNFRENIGYLVGLEYKPIVNQQFKFFGYYYNNTVKYNNVIATANEKHQRNLFSVGVLYFVNVF
jgi:hypothetical protein